ncbi:MAG: hypothetical protein RLZZ600_21 [Actinomycetota bacterium]|jgi:hypothetical protein
MSRVQPGYQPARRGPSKKVRRNRFIAAVVAIALIIWIFTSLSKCSSNDTPSAIPTASETSTPEPSMIPTTAVIDPNATVDPNATPTPGPTLIGAAACDPKALTVVAMTDKTSYGSSDVPKLTMSITNSGATACQANVGSSQLMFQISSSSKIVWQSTDCQTDGTDFLMTLEPKQTVSTSPAIEWVKEVSAPETCKSASRTKVPTKGASYYLTAFVGTSKSAQSKRFILN